MERKKWKGPCCVAWNCSNKQVKRSQIGNVDRNEDITFHRFPSNHELRGEWINAMRRENFKPSTNSRLCSQHFKETDFTGSKNRRRLKEHTVPSIFSFPPHLQPKQKTPRRRLIRQPHRIKQSLHKDRERKGIVHHDHSYYTSQEKLCNMKQRLKSFKTKLQNTRARLRRTSKRNCRLKDIIKNLKNKNLIETEAESLLQDSFSGMSLDLFRHVRTAGKAKKPFYLPKVKNFALSLHFLSPKAYDFVRGILHLPHPRCLRRWKASVKCSPGYLESMLKLASLKARETDSYMCSLIVDEMSLRKDLSWVPSENRYCGFPDFGQGPIGNSVASNALLFMLVSLKGRWKAPIAYFLTDHISSSQLATSVKEAILKAADYGLIVKTFVADGLKANMKAATDLGCITNIHNLRTHFTHPHPDHQQEKIYFICDPPHMLKLFRNLLAERGIIKRNTDDGIKTISWQYIKALHELQSTDSLYLANKLTNKHINYNNIKMKVYVAAQTLSSSVATAIDHLRDDQQLEQFQGSEETCLFLRQIDRLFDVLNSRNSHAKGFKAALRQGNKGYWKSFLVDIQTYLLSLQEPTGLPLIEGKRNQCVLGFIVSAQSTLDLAEDLLSRGSHRYLLTYKFSQDHIEMFFSKIRQRNGWNNNPSSEQFRSALKSLMLNNSIKASTDGNALPLDDTVELQLTPNDVVDSDASPHEYDSEFMVVSSQLESSLTQSHDSDWRQSCIFYTAGFVARRTEQKMKCGRCARALYAAETSQDTRTHPQRKFLQRKDRGGLKVPSSGVVEIIKASEKAFHTIMPSPKLMDSLPTQRYIDLHMQTMVLSSLRLKHRLLFPTLEDHFFDHEEGIEADHITQLIKTVSSFYIKMRLLKAGKLFHQRQILMGQTSKRMKLNKLVLFSGQ